MLERRTAEEADLCDIRRTMARQSALAFDALDHRGFFAADVGACATAHDDLRELGEARFLCLREFLLNEQPDLRILVAQIEIDLFRLDDPCADQHDHDEAVRILAEIEAILERARLAFVAVHRHQAWRGLGADQRPLPPGRKSGAAETAKSGVADNRD